MTNEITTKKKDKLIIQSKESFIKSLPRIVRNAKANCKEEIRAIKTEMHYAKEEYKKRISYLKDRIQTEKNKVLMEKERAKNKDYDKYVNDLKEQVGDRYKFVMEGTQ